MEFGSYTDYQEEEIKEEDGVEKAVVDRRLLSKQQIKFAKQSLANLVEKGKATPQSVLDAWKWMRLIYQLEQITSWENQVKDLPELKAVVYSLSRNDVMLPREFALACPYLITHLAANYPNVKDSLDGKITGAINDTDLRVLTFIRDMKKITYNSLRDNAC